MSRDMTTSGPIGMMAEQTCCRKALATGHWKNWDFITDSDAVRLHGDRFVYRAISSSSLRASLEKIYEMLNKLEQRLFQRISWAIVSRFH